MIAGKDEGADELALSEEESLPWLEGDDEDEGAGKVDGARLAALGAILLAILGLVVGAIWWLTRQGGDQPLLAEGSTIEAPKGPYKQKPKDPGGKTFAGTGDLAPAVGAGKSREATLKPDQPAEAPSQAAGADKAGGALAGPTLAVRTSKDKIVPLDGVGVQVGAYGSREKAEAGWLALKSQTRLLDGVRHRVVKGQADIGTVYRLQAVASNLSEARALCEKLRADGLACQVKR